MRYAGRIRARRTRYSAWPYTHPGHRLLQEYCSFRRSSISSTCAVLIAAARDNGSTSCSCSARRGRSPSDRQGDGVARLHADSESVLQGHPADSCRSPAHGVPASADLRREPITEIHSIVAVSASSDPQKPRREVRPFFSVRHAPDGTRGLLSGMRAARRRAARTSRHRHLAELRRSGVPAHRSAVADLLRACVLHPSGFRVRRPLALAANRGPAPVQPDLVPDRPTARPIRRSAARRSGSWSRIFR